MLSKKFKSNKFYEVTRYVFKYGNEGDEMDASTTVWDSKEKALAYIDRYAIGLKFAAAYMEEITVDREITADDYKKNQYNLVSSQEIYFQNYDGVYEELTEPIYYYKHADETVEETSAPVEEVSRENNKDVITDDNLHSEAFETAPPEVAPDESNRFIDVKIINEPNEKDFIFTVGGYSFQFRKLKDAIKWAKKWAMEQNKDLTIYKKGVAVCRVRTKPQRMNKINIPA